MTKRPTNAIVLRAFGNILNRNQQRAYLRQMLLRRGTDFLLEHEIANLLLAMNNSKINTIFDSEQVISGYGGLYKFLTASRAELSKLGVGQNTIDVFNVVYEASRRLAGPETKVRIMLADTNALALHLGVTNTPTAAGQLIAMFLNPRNHLLDQISLPSDQSIADISVNIARHIISIHATALLLATMHRSASASPTRRDIDITDRMKQMAVALEFKLLEHIIFGSTGNLYSFKMSSDLNKPEKFSDQSHPVLTMQMPKALDVVANRPIDNTGFTENGFSSLYIKPNPGIIRNNKIEEKASGASRRLAVTSDIELLELLLKMAGSRDSTIATRLMGSHASFANILNLKSFDLLSVQGLKPATVVGIKVMHVAAVKVRHAALMDQPKLIGHIDLTRYLKASLPRERIEHFRVLYLDGEGRLQADELQSQGAVDQIEVYPREIVHRALELKAKTLMLARYNPIGDPTPSHEDIEKTRQIEYIAILLGLEIGDYIIIGNDSSFSFRKEGLLRSLL